MKKLLTVCAACLVASLATAQVESQNIVGYQTLDTVPDLNMLTPQFKGVASTAGFDINDLTGPDMVTGTDADSADVIRVWDTSGAQAKYNVYFNYLFPGYEQYAGWTTGLSYFSADYPDGLPAGTAFWYLSRAAAASALTVSGEVISDATTILTLVPGLNMVSSPYPAALKLDDPSQVDFSNATAGTDAKTADEIKIWDTTGAQAKYNVYFNYLYPGYEQYAGWTTGLSYFADDYPNGIPAGAGFWYESKAASDITVTFTRPY